MRWALAALGTLAVIAVSAGTASALGGPRPGACRHLSAEQCEMALGSYAAYDFVELDTIAKLKARRLQPRVAGGGCFPRTHRTPRLYRCTLTTYVTPHPARCIVEALVYQHKHDRFQFRWRRESASCKS